MNAPLPVPQADVGLIKQTLDALFDPDDVIELRAIATRGRKSTSAGYFDGDHRDDLVREAARLNKAGAAIYVTMNRIDPHLLARCANRVQENTTTTVTDANVTLRRWLLLDFDPARPKDTSASEPQLAGAKGKARECYSFLKAESWPEPLSTESGNGMHLLYPLYLPNDNEARDLIKSVLGALAERFDDNATKLDTTVFNAGRVVKLYGTVANKGDHIPLAPWRLSRLVSAPQRTASVTVAQLQALAPAQRAAPTKGAGARFVSSFNLDDFLLRLGIGYRQDTHEGSERYKLAKCPFNPEHGFGEAAIFRKSSGELGFKCQHASCADYHWQNVRELVYGARENRAGRATASGNRTAVTTRQGEQESTVAGAEWPDPQSLPEGLPAVAAFDFALLPETLQPWASDICDRVQCAPDFVGVAIMAGLGSVIGWKLGVRPQMQTDWTVTANQWALIVGRPGVLKSPAMEAALSPLKRLAAHATEAHKVAMQDYQTTAKLAKLKSEAGEKSARASLQKDANANVSHLLSDEEVEAPALKRYIANDSTAAALGELLRQNHNGVLVFRDELVSLLKSLDREDNAEARGFYLTGWNGDSSFTFDRIGRGLNLHIPAVCLSLLGSTQPGRIAEYLRTAVRGGAGDDGLIQRFGLLVWPDTSSEWQDCDRWPDGEARREANRVFAALDKLDPSSIGAQQDEDVNGEPDGIRYLRFDAAGHGLFLEWRTGLEAKLRSGDLHPALEAHLAKYRKLVPGLALICHTAAGGIGAVSEHATLQGLAWAEYLETHARRAYASVTNSEAATAKAIIGRLRKGDLAWTFSSRDVWRPGWAMLSDREQVADALTLLVDLDWLTSTQRETGGRPATVYTANPKGLRA